MTFSQTCSEVSRIIESHHEAASWDAGFDGGEFSGPAHFAAMEREVREVLARDGFTPGTFEAEVERRTTSRWLFFGPLNLGFVEDEEIAWRVRS